ncbi:hypothetical protein BDP27DRAFT_1366603 [Rhodocollybia butyracea]|uniref:Uncharacterized protein n=1 Tax=Rhodocollybia butyracea TaxID=206335 RepID=A0A9P5U431_9AGAR|nr:hypothetical protein BDP27DRAFT_1366603 [Rhodocollybia butyracea]
MCFNSSTDCPFCAETRHPDSLLAHITLHEESTRLHVEMKISANATVVLERTSGEMYSCPAPNCTSIGTIGTLWGHYRDHHLQGPSYQPVISQSKRMASYQPVERPAKRTRCLSPQSSNTSLESISASIVASELYPAPPNVRVDVKPILVQRHSLDGIFGYVAGEMSSIILICPYHAIMTGLGGNGHTQLHQCSEDQITSLQGEYMDIFRKCLRYGEKPEHSVCYRCYSPQMLVFDAHPANKICKGITMERWKHLWFCMSYLVFRVPALRKQVFRELGIAEDSFSTILEYAIWLLQTVYSQPTKPQKQFTNLVLVAHAYFTLDDEGRLIRPDGGFLFPETNGDPKTGAGEGELDSVAATSGSVSRWQLSTKKGQHCQIGNASIPRWTWSLRRLGEPRYVVGNRRELILCDTQSRKHRNPNKLCAKDETSLVMEFFHLRAQATMAKCVWCALDEGFEFQESRLFSNRTVCNLVLGHRTGHTKPSRFPVFSSVCELHARYEHDRQASGCKWLLECLETRTILRGTCSARYPVHSLTTSINSFLNMTSNATVDVLLSPNTSPLPSPISPKIPKSKNRGMTEVVVLAIKRLGDRQMERWQDIHSLEVKVRALEAKVIEVEEENESFLAIINQLGDEVARHGGGIWG